jgi:hypothetical protein
MLPRLGQYGRKSGVRCRIYGVARNLGTFYYERYDTISLVRLADECFMSCRRLNYLHCKITSGENSSVSERRNSSYSLLITLKSDSTVDVPGRTAAMPQQNYLKLENRSPRERQPSAKLNMLG